MHFLLLIGIIAAATAEDVLYNIPGLGEVRGTVIKSPSTTVDTNVHQFTGVPFAQPPVGDLRFAKPAPVQPWAPQTLNATKTSPTCMQVKADFDEFAEAWKLLKDTVVQEDCLYLNLWVPDVASSDKPLPVMVWFFAGGFETGTINHKAYIGDVLSAVGRVIVVAMNYRVSAFGFAHLADPRSKNGAAIPGNLGFMDQQLGLQWVKDYIRPFGGDPNQVTIFGQSAGGASVTAHLVAPGSADLFKRAISQSGSMRENWARRPSAFVNDKTRDLATKLGCTDGSNNSARILRCMRKVSADDILKATKSYTMLPIDNDPFFFQGSVYDRLRSVDLSKKSIMMGNTADEYRFMFLFDNAELFPFNAKWKLDRANYIGLATGLMTESVEQPDEVQHANHAGHTVGADAIDSVLHGSVFWHYDNAGSGQNYVDRLAKLGTDFLLVCEERQVQADWLRLKPKHYKPKDMYLYIYNHTISTPDGLGFAQLKAFHASDIDVIFGTALRRVPFEKGIYDQTTDSVKLSDGSIINNVAAIKNINVKMVHFWTNFAKFGNPNGDGSSGPVDGGDVWEPATDPDTLTFRVLQADDSFSRMIPDINKKDCEMWKEVLKANKRLKLRLDNKITLFGK